MDLKIELNLSDLPGEILGVIIGFEKYDDSWESPEPLLCR
jgi:hypothetical protein